jgi:phage gp29-like protein
VAFPNIRTIKDRILAARRNLARRADVARAAFRNPQGVVKLSEFRAELIGYGRDKEASIGPKPPVTEYVDLPVNTIPDWSVQSIRSAVNAHATGMFTASALLFESMQADDRVQAALNGRVKAVTKCEVTMTPSESGHSGKAKRIAKELEALWPDIFPEQLIEQLLVWTIGQGFCLCEVIWETKDDLWIPRLKVWHPSFVYYDISVRQYVAITQDGPIYVMENDPKWFLYTPFGAYRGWLRGCVRSCSIPWIVRQFALRDWARYSEVHGLPQKKVKYPAQSPAPEKAAFFNAIKRIGSEANFALPQQSGKDASQWDVELLEARDRSWEAFQGLIGQCDKSITLAIRGTDLTTQASGGSSFAAAKVHKDEDSDYAESDAKKFAAAARDQLLKLYCAYNYGDANLAPTPVLAAEQEEDLNDEANTLSIFATAITALEQQNWPVDRQVMGDKFGVVLQQGADPGTAPKPPGDGGPEPADSKTPDVQLPKEDGQDDGLPASH